MKKSVYLLIVIVGFVSCSKKETNLDKYLTHSDKFEKKKVTDPEENFSLYIPKDWEFETRYNDERYNILIFSNIYPESDGTSRYYFNQCKIDIFKVKDSLDLKEQYERFIDNENLDSGETNFLNYPSYFTYSFGKKSYERGAIMEDYEVIHFFLKSKQEDVYYYLIALALKDENQQQNMSMMLHCLQTFEILK